MERREKWKLKLVLHAKVTVTVYTGGHITSIHVSMSHVFHTNERTFFTSNVEYIGYYHQQET